MFPTTEDELADIQSTLQQVARKFHEENYDEYVKEMMAIQLIPWEYRQVISRRGYLNLWKGYQQQILPNNFSPSVYFLLEPVKYAQRVFFVGNSYYDIRNSAKLS